MGSPSGGICSVVPFYSRTEISLTLKNQVGLDHYLLHKDTIRQQKFIMI